MNSVATRIAAKQAVGLAEFGLKLAPWGATFGLLGGWLVYPTLTSEFKDNFGMADAPAPGMAPSVSVSYTKGGIGETPEVKQ